MLPTITCRATAINDSRLDALRPDLERLCGPDAPPAAVNEALLMLSRTLYMSVPPVEPAMPTDHPDQRATIRHINQANAKVPASAYLDSLTAEIQAAYPDYRPPLIMGTPTRRSPDMPMIALAACAYRIFERLTGKPPIGKRDGGERFIRRVFEVCSTKGKGDESHYLPVVRTMLTT